MHISWLSLVSLEHRRLDRLSLVDRAAYDRMVQNSQYCSEERIPQGKSSEISWSIPRAQVTTFFQSTIVVFGAFIGERVSGRLLEVFSTQAH